MISQTTESGSYAWSRVFATATFLGAFILFLTEPLVGKSLLPWYGGTPAVWNTCVVFFQLILLLGYLYSHLLHRYLTIRRQFVVHATLSIAALLTLPVRMNIAGLDGSIQYPVFSLLGELITSIGLVFFVVSTTAPLLQAWYSTSRFSGSPYLLYVASNVGSLVGLLVYPTFVEFWFPLSVQRQLLTWSFVGLVVLIASCGIYSLRNQQTPIEAAPGKDNSGHSVTFAMRWNWFLWSLCPSSLMLGVTTYLSTEIAPIPAIWMLPLSLYLISFIIAFAQHPRWLAPTTAIGYIVVAILAVLIRLENYDDSSGSTESIVLHAALLFCGAISLHCQLSETRPATKHLTEFYLWISVGGLCGSVFNSILAPFIFNWLAEYPIMIALGVMLLPLPRFESQQLRFFDPTFRLTLVGIVLVGMSWNVYFSQDSQRFVLRERTFFGVFHVLVGAKGKTRMLVHGSRIIHGAQIISDVPRERRPPLTYYFFTGPIGQLILGYRGTPVTETVGVVGLGIGSIASYAERGEEFTFYEIDPAIAHLAEDKRYFNFLGDARDRGAKANVVVGDARLRLREAPDHSYGLIVLDAFTSDAIPVHLITKEAITEYFSKLRPGGLLAFHISNQYLDLEPVLAGIASNLGYVAFIQGDLADVKGEEDRKGKTLSVWVVMSSTIEPLAPILSTGRWRGCRIRPELGVWTDDRSNLLSVIGWHR